MHPTEHTSMCGAWQPVIPPMEPYRCTRPYDHPGDHQAEIDGLTVAEWPRVDPS